MLAPDRDIQPDSNGAVSWHPGRLWSLWDIMINYQIFGLSHLLLLLASEEWGVQRRLAIIDMQKQMPSMERVLGITDTISNQDRERWKGHLQYATSQADQLELQAVHDRIAHFTGKLRFEMSLQDYLGEIRALREAFLDGINFKYFYLYPRRKAEALLQFETAWGDIAKAFPAVRQEAHCAVDLYALNHNTASVFHSMRVAEHGLRAIAKERRIRLPKNKPVEWGTWQEIIKALNDEAVNIAKTKKAGPVKDRALEFYSGAVADLNGFKDEFRNLAFHVRVEYDELQALRALRRVHEFMERISKKIDHRHHRIRWGFR
jgi:hypothetical protein